MDKHSDEVIKMLSKQLNKKPADITADKRIKEDLGADSLDVVEMLMTVEEKYGITIEDSVLMGVKTVGDLVNVIGNLVK